MGLFFQKEGEFSYKFWRTFFKAAFKNRTTVKVAFYLILKKNSQMSAINVFFSFELLVW